MKKKKIAIVFRDCKSGVRTFIEGVLFALNDFQENNHLDITLVHDQEKYKEHPSLQNFQHKLITRKNKFYWDYVASTRYLKKKNFDVTLYPKNFIPLSHSIIRSKKIVVVHDLCALNKQLREFGWADTWYTRLMSKPSFQMANKIIAVSKSTKNDIHTFFNIPNRKIEVVHEAAGDKFQKKEVEKSFLKKYALKKPFLFYCGALSPRKNILRLLQAFQKIENQIPHNVYISGLVSYRDTKVKDYIQKFLAKRVFLLGKIPLDDLVNFYNSADAFVYPSLYEGFGLPILEAQKCGCPVLTSNTTSCPEVAGQGAVIINPISTEDIANGILKILEDQKYRQRLIQKGYENESNFSWKRAAKELLQIINDH
jgi:glycosyltransferase involved in cell wall biosynthesis